LQLLPAFIPAFVPPQETRTGIKFHSTISK
jgi:hypothetical protein